MLHTSCVFGRNKEQHFSRYDHHVVRLALEGSYTQAHFLSLASQTTDLKTLVQWLRAIDSKSDMTKLERQRFVQEKPNWPGLSTIKSIAERRPVLGTEVEGKQLVAYYEKYKPQKNAEYMGFLNALQTLGDNERAISIARQLWRSRTFLEKDEKEFVKRFGKYFTQKDQEERMRWLMANDHALSGRRQIERVKASKDYPFFTAQLALLEDSNIAPSIEKALSPEQRKHYTILHPKIRRNLRRGYLTRATEDFFNLDTRTATPQQLIKTRLMLARDNISYKRYKTAYKVLRGHGLTKGENFVHAEWIMGWLAFRMLGLNDTAIEHFRKASAQAQDRWQPKVRFWLGTAYQKQDQPVAAVRAFGSCARYPYDFYGQLCLQAMGLKRFEGDFSRPLNHAADFPKDLRTAAALLSYAGEWGKASMFLQQIRKGLKGEEAHRQLIIFTQALGLQNLSYLLAEQFLYVGSDVWAHARPIVKLDIKDLDDPLERAMFYALIYQESRFKPNAQSKAGAQGLAQLMPATARDIAKKHGIKLKSRQELLDNPNLNANLGWKYIGWVRGQVGERWLYILPAYNAGHARVKEWKKRFGEPGHSILEALDWIEHIPYRETRNYIIRVLENVAIYDSLLAGKAQPLRTAEILAL